MIDRLRRFGVNTDGDCYFCNGTESVNHLFFECLATKVNWKRMLVWPKFDHNPERWELDWTGF